MNVNSLLLTIVVALSVLLSRGTAAEQHLYLAAGGQIVVYDLDSETGKLKVLQSVDLAGSGPFTFSHDNKRLYAVATQKGQPQIATFERKGNGTLKLVHMAPVEQRAGYLDLDRTGTYLAGNSYKAGKVSLWKLDDGVYRGETVVELDLEPKAHGANFSADNQWLLVPATGPNKVFVNRFDAAK